MGSSPIKGNELFSITPAGTTQSAALSSTTQGAMSGKLDDTLGTKDLNTKLHPDICGIELATINNKNGFFDNSSKLTVNVTSV